MVVLMLWEDPMGGGGGSPMVTSLVITFIISQLLINKSSACELFLFAHIVSIYST